jgi:uncharacterized membrane protein
MQPSPWLETLGRLHVVLVHFPIALLLVAGIIEIWRAIRRKDAPSPAAAVCLGFGALWAALASASGWVHKDFSPSMAGSALTWHTYLGFATAGVALLSLMVMGLRRWGGPTGRMTM